MRRAKFIIKHTFYCAGFLYSSLRSCLRKGQNVFTFCPLFLFPYYTSAATVSTPGTISRWRQLTVCILSKNIWKETPECALVPQFLYVSGDCYCIFLSVLLQLKIGNNDQTFISPYPTPDLSTVNKLFSQCVKLNVCFLDWSWYSTKILYAYNLDSE